MGMPFEHQLEQKPCDGGYSCEAETHIEGCFRHENRAGRAELSERIVIEAPEGHLLQGQVEITWWRDGTFSFEFECFGTSAPTFRPRVIDFDGETFELSLEPGE